MASWSAQARLRHSNEEVHTLHGFKQSKFIYAPCPSWVDLSICSLYSLNKEQADNTVTLSITGGLSPYWREKETFADLE